jgi:DNA-binding NarL/FixJ family response regulator
MKKRIAIADEQEAVRELLCHYLERLSEYEVVAQAGTGLEAVRLFKKTCPHLAIIDLLLPQLCGCEVLSRMRRELPEMRIVVFTGTSDPIVLTKALRKEPDGIVHKSEPLEILSFALRTVSVGGRFFSPKLNRSVGHSASEPAQVLSAREIEVMQSIAEGKSNKEIAVLLGVATKTVDNHRSRLMQKLGIHNAASLTLAAVQMGVVPLSRIPVDVFQGSVRSEKFVSRSRGLSRDTALSANGDKELAIGTTADFLFSHQASIARTGLAGSRFFDLVP